MASKILTFGEFKIVKRLGTGARSTIYLAHDQQKKKDVALKRVILERPEDTRIFEQVETEFKVANRIDHPYVRKCYKLKKKRSMLKVKELLLSMELFDGETLEETKTLSLVDVLLVFRMVASGLHAMHQKGFVHCDIKPNNIMINNTGSIKIIDLGQSCRIGTTKQRIQGTPDYIAPEQVKRNSLGPKTDIFNLGATMYWALTGEAIPTMIPKNNGKVGDLNLPKEKKPPKKIRPKIPQKLSNIVMYCVKDKLQDRPQNMMEVITELDTMVHDLIGDKINFKNAGNRNKKTKKSSRTEL